MTQIVQAAELPLIQRALESPKLKELDAVARRCMDQCEDAGPFTRAAFMAASVTELRNRLTDELVQAIFMPLQNRRLGFLTDRKETGYPVQVVRDCLIDATMRGVQPVCNMFNIVAAQTYITKEGFTYLLKIYPGLTDLVTTFSVPRIVPGGAEVDAAATWKLNGVAQSIPKRTFPIKVNAGMGADAILGKAERKLKHAIYMQITGSDQSIPEGEVEEPSSIALVSRILGAAADEKAPAPITPEELAAVGRRAAPETTAPVPAMAPAPATPPAPTGPTDAPMTPDEMAAIQRRELDEANAARETDAPQQLF